ncbi:MAG: sulfotransferase domain-containing protein [Gillisia sp.]
MKILQIGVPKSGNLWLYKILQNVLDFSGNANQSFIQQQPIFELAKNWDLNYPDQAQIDVIDITDLQVSYRISSIFRMPMEDLQGYFSKTSHVWTHSPICNTSEEVFSHFSKKVYIIRDPRDVLISASKYYTSDYMLKYFPQEQTDPEKFLQKNFDKLLREWVWHVWDHLRVQQKNHIHICYFEGFLTDFQNELSQLLKYLDVDLTSGEKEKLEENVSFSKMKKKNPKHLRKGTTGQWKEGLTDHQREKVEQITGPILKETGYLQKDAFKRDFSETDFQKLKEEIIFGLENAG